MINKNSNSIEMKYLLFTVTLNLLFFTNLVSSDVPASVNPIYDDAATSTKKFEIKHHLLLSCNVTYSKEYVVKWEKNGTSIDEVPLLNNRKTLAKKGTMHTLKVDRAGEEDAGNYSCVVYTKDKEPEEVGRGLIIAGSNVRVKTPDNINVVEGEKLRIHCIVYGRPAALIEWHINSTSYNSSTDRIQLLKDDKDISNAILQIDDVEMTDRGEYECRGFSELTKERVKSVTMVRVKDKYAALWPFLGICAEVFVLCAIILIYEKKRNKTELEESDTDQSPDQKNTPDHGKESNLRHRQ